MSENTIVVKRKLLWELTGKEKMRKYKIGKAIKSDLFDIIVDGKLTQWFLVLYPNGEMIDHDYYCGLYLYVKNPLLAVFDVKAKYGVVSEELDFMTEDTNELSGEHADFPEWVYHATFPPGMEYFDGDKLRLFCELTISALPGRKLVKIDDNPTIDFTHMFEKEELKDCEIHTSDGVTLKFHKCVLAAQSEVFYNMFTIDMAEARSNVVHIKDFDAETLTQLLRFAYGLPVQDLGAIAHDLIFAAEKYGMMKLKKICLWSLFENLDQKKVLQSLVISDNFSDAEPLFDKCVSIVAGNYEALSKTPEWKTLSHSTKDKIIGRLAPFYNVEQQIFSSANF